MAVETLGPDSGAGRERMSNLPYSGSQVGVATFIGGPLAGGWLMARTFSAFGKTQSASRAVYASVAVLVLVVFAAFKLPTDFSSTIVSGAAVIGYAMCYSVLLGPKFNEHVLNDGAKASWWGVFGRAITAMLVTLIVMVGLAFTVPIEPVNSVRTGPNITYYEDAAEREDAEALSRYFEEVGVFNEHASWYITLVIPDSNPPRMRLEIPFTQPIEMTPAHAELIDLHALLEDRYRNREVSIAVQNDFGLTQFVIRGD